VKRKTWVLAAAAVLVAVTATGGVVAISGATQATPAAQEPPANTVKVEKGKLSAMVSLAGTLTHRARSDGSPYSVINQAGGIYTKLPDDGDEVACGDVLYRVDDDPVVLLCGAIPAYRDLRRGDVGRDIRQLNRNLHRLGYDVDLDDNHFTWETEKALKKLQHDKGFDATGALDVDDGVFLPKSARIAKVTGRLGGFARPGAQVAQATGGALEVQVALAASQQGEVKKGDRAQITLPGNSSVKGRVDRLGRVARAAGQDDDVGHATIPAYISLDEPKKARGLDRAPVQVDITTKGVASALSVPVTALVRSPAAGSRSRSCATAGDASWSPSRWVCSTPRADESRSRAILPKAIKWWCRRYERRIGSGTGWSDQGVYGEQPPVPALRGVSFSVRRGELVAIVGPSGSGKSTLLHVIGTLERPSGGVVRIGGVDAAGLSDRELSLLRAREIGFVFQQFFLAEHATVRENVADGLLYAGVPAAERYRRADEALERVGLSDRATFKLTKISGGERQRVAIARALVGRPAIVLADEPTGSLDSTTGASIMELIRELNAAGATIIMITHDAGLADQLPRQVRMLDGQVVFDT
jgi:putative ABC transport system ATP-binding protein